MKAPLASVVTTSVVGAREAAAAGTDREREDRPGSVLLANSMINLQAGDGPGERRVDLADEGRVGDVGVLIADDARVVGRPWESSRRS